MARTGFEANSVLRKKHTSTQIVAKLRQADILIGQGETVPEVCKEIELLRYLFRQSKWRRGCTWVAWTSGAS